VSEHEEELSRELMIAIKAEISLARIPGTSVERFGLVAAIKEIVSEMRRRIAFDVMDLDILDRALGFWSSDDNDAPHVAIATLRERLRALRKP